MGATSDFTDYLYRNYVASNTLFPPPLWADEPIHCPRTNNAVESFHSHFNAMFYQAHHLAIDSILEIQIESDLKITSILTNEVNLRSSTTVDKINTYNCAQTGSPAVRKQAIQLCAKRLGTHFAQTCPLFPECARTHTARFFSLCQLAPCTVWFLSPRWLTRPSLDQSKCKVYLRRK